MTTILDVLEKGTEFLSQKGVSDARLNMELLTAHELGCQRMDLYLRFDQPVENDALSRLRISLKNRGLRTPLQHIIGFSNFHSSTFKSDHRALIPRPETEELVELICEQPFPRPARILDLGCGSGVLGLSIAKTMGIDCEQLLLADLSTEALSLAKENSESLEIEARLLKSNLFSSVEGTFDLIVANLPYIPVTERADLAPEVLFDPEMALFGGVDGLDLIRPFCEQVPAFLNPGGLVAMEVGYQQGETTRDLLTAGGLTKAHVHSDLCEIPRFPLAWK